MYSNQLNKSFQKFIKNSIRFLKRNSKGVLILLLLTVLIALIINNTVSRENFELGNLRNSELVRINKCWEKLENKECTSTIGNVVFQRGMNESGGVKDDPSLTEDDYTLEMCKKICIEDLENGLPCEGIVWYKGTGIEGNKKCYTIKSKGFCNKSHLLTKPSIDTYYTLDSIKSHPQSWQYPIPDSNNYLYVGMDTNQIYCYNLGGGRKWMSDNVGQVLSSIVMDSHGTLYFGSKNGNLYAYHNPFTNLYTAGKRKWVASINVARLCTPTIGLDGSIYIVSNNNYLYAINSKDGTEKWKSDLKICCWNNKHSYYKCSPTVNPINGVIYVGDTLGTLYAINPLDGVKKWSFNITGWENSDTMSGFENCVGDVGGQPGIILTPVIGSDNIIYFGVGCYGHSNGLIYAVRDNGSRAEEVWHSNAYKAPSNKILLKDSILYVASSPGWKPHLFAIKAEDGRQLWELNLNPNISTSVNASPIIDKNNNIIVNSIDELYIVKVSDNGGAVDELVPKLYANQGGPVLDSDNNIYLVNGNRFRKIVYNETSGEHSLSINNNLGTHGMNIPIIYSNTNTGILNETFFIIPIADISEPTTTALPTTMAPTTPGPTTQTPTTTTSKPLPTTSVATTKSVDLEHLVNVVGNTNTYSVSLVQGEEITFDISGQVNVDSFSSKTIIGFDIYQGVNEEWGTPQGALIGSSNPVIFSEPGIYPIFIKLEENELWGYVFLNVIAAPPTIPVLTTGVPTTTAIKPLKIIDVGEILKHNTSSSSRQTCSENKKFTVLEGEPITFKWDPPYEEIRYGNTADGRVEYGFDRFIIKEIDIRYLANRQGIYTQEDDRVFSSTTSGEVFTFNEIPMDTWTTLEGNSIRWLDDWTKKYRIWINYDIQRYNYNTAGNDATLSGTNTFRVRCDNLYVMEAPPPPPPPKQQLILYSGLSVDDRGNITVKSHKEEIARIPLTEDQIKGGKIKLNREELKKYIFPNDNISVINSLGDDKWKMINLFSSFSITPSPLGIEKVASKGWSGIVFKQNYDGSEEPHLWASNDSDNIYSYELVPTFGMNMWAEHKLHSLGIELWKNI